MSFIFSLHKQWCEAILSGEKPIEFRTILPNHINTNDTIYLYETAKNGGERKVVGECQVDYIIPVLSPKGEWPVYGAYPFIDYFYEFVKGDKALAEKYRELKREFGDTLQHRYRYGFIVGYAFSDTEIQSLRENGELVNVMKVFDFRLIDKIVKENDESKKYIEECDEWLSHIGYYDDSDESQYKYGIVLKNPVRYDKSKELSCFANRDGEPISRPPQSWMYASCSVLS